MANRPKKSSRVEDLVEALGAIDSHPNSEQAKGLIREGLGHKHWMPVEHAARIVAQHGLAGFTQELLAVWNRFVDPGPKLDPGCRAKESALVALDTLECFDPEPFLVAIRYIQLEPGYGGAGDTAGGVRQRALFGLLRQRHSQAPLYAGELLADRLVEVRVGTADALGQYGGLDGAGLLVHRLSAGDDARVLLACASALLALEAPFARSFLAKWLEHEDEEHREVGAIALGQCRSDETGELLVAWFDDMAWDRDFDLGARALALHRSERTRRCLLEHIAGGSTTRARAAIRALAAHRYDEKLCEQVRAAARQNPVPALVALVDELYPPAQSE
jgi:hypothetical protein